MVKSTPSTKPRLRQNSLTLLLFVILAVGIFFRVTHLEGQVYWHDETFTSLRVSGYSASEVIQALFNGNVVGLEALQRYQQPNPGKTVWDTVHSLAVDDSQHPPLYYILVRQWAIWFGPSVTAMRSLSALVSLLVFPSVYWLCQELFGWGDGSVSSRQFSQLVSGLVIALIALSPFHVLYAQEAREYSLWSVLILLAGAALLRAIRVNRVEAWGLFTGLLILGLYTQPLTLFVAIAFGIYLWVVQGFRISQITVSGLIALVLALLAFMPWLKIIAQTWSKTGATWTSVPLPLSIVLKTWGLHLAREFILTEGDFGFDHWTMYIGLPLLLGLVGTAFYSLIRHTPLRTWLFVVLLTISVFLPLGLMDLVLGGQRSVSSRYIVPFYLGVPVALAYLFAHKLLQQQTPAKRPSALIQSKRWQGTIAAVLSVSLICCILNADTETAWTKGINYNLPTVAKLINAAPRPLVVSNSFGINFGSTFALARQLDGKAKLQLVAENAQPKHQSLFSLNPNFSDVFVLNPSEAFRQQLEQERKKPQLVFQDFHLFLWKLTVF